jgi:DNA-binding SARP family transcriptional activator
MIRIKLFGATRVESAERQWEAAELGGAKARQILAMLAVSLGTPVPKEQIAECLWEGTPPASYVATLESYICVLRRQLGLGSGRNATLATTNKCYVLDPSQVSVDLVDVRAALAVGTPAAVSEALNLVSGDLLGSDPYVAWANEEREAFAEELAVACTKAASQAGADGDDALAAELARTAVRQSYFSEASRQELMKALFRLGERTQALNVYAALRAEMLEELGIEPSPATQRLYLLILRGGSVGTERSHNRFEVMTLLRLLRQAYEAGVEVDGPEEPGLVELGRLVLSPLFASAPPRVELALEARAG